MIYGLVGLKTHSKITLVVRMEDEGNPGATSIWGTGELQVTPQPSCILTAVSSPATRRSGRMQPLCFNMLSGYSGAIGLE